MLHREIWIDLVHSEMVLMTMNKVIVKVGLYIFWLWCFMMYVVASSTGWQLRTVVLDHLAYGLKPQWILVGRNVSICVIGQGMIVWLYLGFIKLCGINMLI